MRSKWIGPSVYGFAILALLSLVAAVVGAQQVSVTPDSLVLRVGDTARVVATVKGVPGAALSYTGTDAAVFTAHRDGRITARAVGCAMSRVSYGTWTRAQVAVCVVAAAPAPVPVPTPTPTPAGLLVNARWTAALGSSITAVTDGGKANDPYWCDWSQILSVVPGSSVGAPAGNALAVRSIAGGCGHVEFRDLFPTPAAGQFWAVRYYVMNGVGQTDTKMHPLTHFPVGAIEAVHTGFYPVAGGNGDWHHGSGWPNGPLFPWYPGTDVRTRRVLTAGTWYRYEYILEWLDDARFRVWPRLYDMSGALLNDAASWWHSDGAGSYASWYAAGNAFRAHDPQHMRNLSFGMGQSGSAGGSYYAADFAAAVVGSRTAFLGAP